MTFRYAAFGCKVNQYEIRACAAALQDYGLAATAFGRPADVCVINTCCVTGESEAKSRKMIHRARRASPDGVLVVTGCFSQITKESIPEVDLIVANADKDRCAQLIMAFLRERGADPAPTRPVHYEPLARDRTRATVKVQDGCDSFCSYCIIPYARGGLCSKPPDKAYEEITALARLGFREVVLTGIHLTRYGVDLPGKDGLCELVERVSGIEGIERIRLGSLEPGYLEERNIRKLAGCEKLCGHFHLSLQSGCDRTLRRMNRRYTALEYFKEISLLRTAFPECAITTDIMVGFPGETEEEFAQSAAFVKKCAFAKTHVFSYSVRPGTAAAEMAQVEEPVKRARSKAMQVLARESRSAFLAGMIGRVLPVLVERVRDGRALGLTENYIPISVVLKDGMRPGRNEMIDVRLTRVVEDGCEGEFR